MDATRRRILLGTGGALGAVALAAPAAAGAARERMALLSTYVAGTAYHDALAAASLRPGDPLALRRERRNDYDPRAVEVRTPSNAKLGYVPRTDNRALASLMDAGFDVSACVREIVPDRRQPEIRLDVFLTI